MAGAVRKGRIKEIPLSEIKDDLSRFLRWAEKQEIVITRHGKPAGVLIGFESEDDWFDYKLENDPRFLERVEQARKSLRAGRGIRVRRCAQVSGRSRKSLKRAALSVVSRSAYGVR